MILLHFFKILVTCVTVLWWYRWQGCKTECTVAAHKYITAHSWLANAFLIQYLWKVLSSSFELNVDDSRRWWDITWLFLHYLPNCTRISPHNSIAAVHISGQCRKTSCNACKQIDAMWLTAPMHLTWLGMLQECNTHPTRKSWNDTLKWW